MPGDLDAGWRRLLEIVASLRAEGGCPWDRQQTLQTMRPYLLEETHEVLETLDADDPVALREELGDLLFNVVMVARIAEEAGLFSIDDVARDISDKMIVRHPHVFDPEAHGIEASTVAAWEARKSARAEPGRSRLDGLPPSLPALLHASRAGEKAAQIGLDWPDYAGVRGKLREELGELDAALRDGDEEAVEREYGDVLLTAAHLGRFLGAPPEDALRGANARFGARFRGVEQRAREAGLDLGALSAAELDALWSRVKRET